MSFGGSKCGAAMLGRWDPKPPIADRQRRVPLLVVVGPIHVPSRARSLRLRCSPYYCRPSPRLLIHVTNERLHDQEVWFLRPMDLDAVLVVPLDHAAEFGRASCGKE